MKLSTIAMAAALFGAATLTQAQMPNGYDQVAQREFNQQHRIAAGVRDGQLTRGHAFRLERQERGIHREVRAMRYEHGGHLTPYDRHVLYRQQNRVSRRIYRDRRF
ncbi:MAG: hypothetical protein ABSD59_09095 [Terracidiphilus sp.]